MDHSFPLSEDILRAKTGIKIKMRVKLAAKLLPMAWMSMKKKEPFDPRSIRAAGQSVSAKGGRER